MSKIRDDIDLKELEDKWIQDLIKANLIVKE